MKYENLPDNVRAYLTHLAAAYTLAPQGGWAIGKIWAVLDEELTRYRVVAPPDVTAGLTPIVDEEDPK